MGNSSFGLSIFFILHPLAFGALISAQYFRNSHHEGSKARRNFHRKIVTLSHIIPIRFLAVTIQPCHCEPFSGEAISRLSDQLDRLGIASSQRTLLAMTSQTVLRQG
jgi:hypothetical protein